MKKIAFGAKGFSSAYRMLTAAADIGGDVQLVWGKLTPGSQSQPHQHSEKEIYVVIAGEGMVHARDEEYSVKKGDYIIIEPLEIHYLSNTGSEDLVVADLFWQKRSASFKSVGDEGNDSNAPIFVFSPPPTPNGDLHIGHLSGPYLGADVYKRYARMLGRRAYHLTGSDDYQSYVRSLAKKNGVSEAEIAKHYSHEVRKTLELFDIECDNFLCTSDNEAYGRYMQSCFAALKRHLSFQETPALFDATTGEYLYEVDVSGDCPACGSKGNGNICEQCGEPNVCVDMVDSKSNITGGAPRVGVSSRYTLALHEHFPKIRQHLDHSKASPRIRALVENILEKDGFFLQLSHPDSWGVKIEDDEYSDQVIWVWVNMFFGFLYGIEALGRRQGEDWSKPKDDWKLVHFFGFDNSFYYTTLYPVLHGLVYPDWKSSIEYNYNEFYLLDHKKFSTSRRHAIWGKEILNVDTVDIIRYFLSKTRAEFTQTNFDLDNLLGEVESTLLGKWQKWINELQHKVSVSFSGKTPCSGLWIPEHGAYVESLASKYRQLSIFYSAQSFSLRSAIALINSVIDDVIGFSTYNLHLSSHAELHSYYRTATALEVTTLRVLAEMVYPIMPRYALHLFSLISMNGVPSWSKEIEIVDGGIPMMSKPSQYFSAGFEWLKDFSGGRV